MNAAPHWMIDEITARGGEILFEEYMELALYHPVHGYYSGVEPRYGRGGDFLTAPTASEWYARVLTRLLRRIADDSGPVRLIDLASGDGSLVAEVLEDFGLDAGDVLGKIVSVERTESMRRRQTDRLPTTSVDVEIVAGLDRIAPSRLPTVVHASELYDAMPVARVVGESRGPAELAVTVSSGQLSWRRRPPRDEVARYFDDRGIELENGQIAEANLGAEGLHRRLLHAVADNGLSLVLDYGYEVKRLYDARGRRGGSLATFRRHELGRDPLRAPGEIDLTAHVNWDDLRLAADAAGWQEIGLWQLAEFLVRSGLEAELEERGLGVRAELDAATVAARQEIKRLLDPEGMGSDLKMLVQARGEMVDVASAALALD